MSDYTALTTGTYANGMAVIVGFIFLMLVVISILDLLCAIRKWPAIGYRVQRWSRKNPLFVSGLLLVAMMLLTHFAGNSIHYQTVKTSSSHTQVSKQVVNASQPQPTRSS